MKKLKAMAQEEVARNLDKLPPVRGISKEYLNELQSQLKKVEFAKITTLKSAQVGIHLISLSAKKILNNSNLSNRQKAEVTLVAQLEALRIVEALVEDISKLEN